MTLKWRKTAFRTDLKKKCMFMLWRRESRQTKQEDFPMHLTTLSIEKPETINFILGQTHFIKSVEDIHEALVARMDGLHNA